MDYRAQEHQQHSINLVRVTKELMDQKMNTAFILNRSRKNENELPLFDKGQIMNKSRNSAPRHFALLGALGFLLSSGDLPSARAQLPPNQSNPPPECAGSNIVSHAWLSGRSTGTYYTCSDYRDNAPACPTDGVTGDGGGGPVARGKFMMGGSQCGDCTGGSKPGGGNDGSPKPSPDCDCPEDEGGWVPEYLPKLHGLPLSYGMPTWSVSHPNMSVSMRDTPFYYNNSRGRPVAFELNYKSTPGTNGYTDNLQPRIFSVGKNWHTPWRSYLQLGGYYNLNGWPSANQDMFFAYLGDGSARQYALNVPDLSSRAVLTATNSEYWLTFPSGAKNVYGLTVVMGGMNDCIFLTRKEDPHGTTNTFAYIVDPDLGSVRLDTVTDSDGEARAHC